MFLHHLASHLHRTVGEVTASMTPTELTNWMAYFRIWPTGEWALDKRFEVLRMDISGLREQIRTGIPVIMTKRGSRPKRHELHQFKIFDRHGDKVTKHYDDLTQEEINKRMRKFATELKAKGDNG